MSAFEDFVQTELPKRGYLNSDVPQESIIIRRGAGPRQFDAITMTEGQVLAFVGGQLQAVSMTSLVSSGLKKAILTVSEATDIWTINHNLGYDDVIVQCFDDQNFVLIPDTTQIVDANTVRITFSQPQTGVARVIFLD
jgi:ABC-type transport system substrate-binding protein